MNKSKALLGAGCFWGVQELFRKTKGVIDTEVGYAGGNTINPTYEEVCSNNTGHAEVVMIAFDTSIVSFNKILEIFWNCHDPTQLNRQGLDIGTQYRSIIFYFSDEQKESAIKSKNYFQKKFTNLIVTEINNFENFYLAEDYHQCYIKKKSSFKS